MQVAKRFLFGDDIDVQRRCIRHKFANVRVAHVIAGWRGERIRFVRKRVLKVRRVHVQLVLGERAQLLLLKYECRDRSARQVVVKATPSHRRPIANARTKNGCAAAGILHELLQCLHAVKHARVRAADNVDARTFGDEHIALGGHCTVEGEAGALQQALRRRVVGAVEGECDRVRASCRCEPHVSRTEDVPQLEHRRAIGRARCRGEIESVPQREAGCHDQLSRRRNERVAGGNFWRYRGRWGGAVLRAKREKRGDGEQRKNWETSHPFMQRRRAAAVKPRRPSCPVPARADARTGTRFTGRRSGDRLPRSSRQRDGI